MAIPLQSALGSLTPDPKGSPPMYNEIEIDPTITASAKNRSIVKATCATKQNDIEDAERGAHRPRYFAGSGSDIYHPCIELDDGDGDPGGGGAVADVS